PVYGVGRLVFWVGVAGLEDGIPVAANYTATRTATGLDFGISTCPGDCPGGTIAFGAAAAAGPLTEAVHEPPAWLAPMDGPTAARLLQLQTEATPGAVAPPFSIVELTPRGIAWIDRGSCQGDHTL